MAYEREKKPAEGPLDGEKTDGYTVEHRRGVRQMREELFSREIMLVGREAVERLSRRRVAVFGLGGVGGHAAEALARAGVGEIDLVDADRVSLSNLNRQLIATLETVGRLKVEVMAERIAQVNPFCKVRCHPLFYLPETAAELDLSPMDYVVDAVDTVSAKVELAVRCQALGVRLISAMGTGNKLDPGKFVITDLARTQGCPLARVMRRELRRRGVEHLTVCYSTEEACRPLGPDGQPSRVPGSISFVPGVAGLMMAGEVVRTLMRPEA